MRTRLDVDDYRLLTTAQRAEVDAYLTDLGLPPLDFAVTEVAATAEGTVRVERIVTPLTWVRCGTCGTLRDYLYVRQTFRPSVPPPWLAWPDPYVKADSCE